MNTSAMKNGKREPTLDTAALARLADEVIQQIQRGEEVDPSVLAIRYPDQAEKLSELLPAIQALADLSQSGKGVGPLGEDPLEDSADSPGKNRELGDFRILRQIGRGGMGIVYEAEQISLRRHVALKILPLAGVLDPRHLARFKNESLAAAALQHPNIVPVYAVGCERGVHYYAMQYVAGQNLAELIRELRIREGLDEWQADANDETSAIVQQLSDSRQADADLASKLEGQKSAGKSTLVARKGSSTQRTRQEQTAYYRNIAQLGLQAAKALAHAHEEGVIHRDIKPSNLLLDAHCKLWVTDFGLARTKTDAGVTLTGDLLGTLRYMSPEQAQAKRIQVDHRTDIYSLGATLYELLTLQPMFASDNQAELLRKITFDDPLPPRRLCSDLPLDLETIILKSVEKDPRDRYDTATVLAEELGRYLDNAPILARRPTIRQTAFRWCRRHRGVVTGLALVLLAWLMTGGGTWWWVTQERFHRQQETIAAVSKALDETQVQKTKANAATDAAKKANEKVKNALASEERQRRIAETTLVDMYTSFGLDAGGRDDDSEAFLWFATAATSANHDPQRESSNRLRCRNWLRHLPVPVASMRNTIGSINTLDIHPRNTHVMIHTSGGVVIWDLKSEKATTELNCSAVWSPDGNMIAIGHANGDVEIRMFPQGTVIDSRKVDGRGNFRCLAFSGNSRQLALGVLTVRIWNLEAREFLHGETELDSRLESLEFTPDGKNLVVCGSKGARVYGIEHDLLSSEPRFTPIEHLSHGVGVGNTRFHPPVISNDIALFNTKAGLFGHDLITGKRSGLALNDVGLFGYSLSTAAMSSDRRYLAISSDTDRAVYTYDLTTNQRLAVIKASTNRIGGLAFQPHGESLVTFSDDSMLRFWNPTTGAPSGAAIRHQGYCKTTAVSPDGSLCATAQGDQVVRVFTIPNARRCADASWSMSSSYLSQEPALDRQGQWAVTPGARWGQTPPELGVFETRTGKLRRFLPRQKSLIGTTISPNGQVVAAFMCDQGASSIDAIVASSRESIPGQISAWDLADESAKELSIATSSVALDGAFSPDGKMLAAICKNGDVLLIDVSRAVVVATGSHPGDVQVGYKLPRRMLRFSNRGDRFVSLGIGNVVRMWNDKLAVIADLPNDEFVRDANFSPRGDYLVTACEGVTARVWDADTGEPLGRPMKHPDGVMAATFSPDGRLVATSCRDKMVRVWDWRSGQLVCPGLDHVADAQSAAFSKDGALVVTASDKEVKFWEIHLGREIAPLRTMNDVELRLAIDDSRTHAVVSGYKREGQPSNSLEFLTLREFDPIDDFDLAADELKTLAELISSRRVENGGTVNLTSDEWLARWVSMSKCRWLSRFAAEHISGTAR